MTFYINRSSWFRYGENAYNLDDFCHIWIQTCSDGYQVKGYFVMGQWRHNGEKIPLSATFDHKCSATSQMDEFLGFGQARR